MTMLLMSSGQFFTEKAEKLLNKSFKKFRIAYITTASIPATDKNYVTERKKRMEELSWDFEEIDIAGKNKAELKSLLCEKNIVYLEGGNTFFLLKHIKESGFEEVIRDLIQKGVIFAGSSAGAYVACPTIEMARHFNVRHEWDECGLKNLSAMGLISFLLKVHYTSDDKKELDLMREESEYRICSLSDEQALLVEEGDFRVYG